MAYLTAPVLASSGTCTVKLAPLPVASASISPKKTLTTLSARVDSTVSLSSGVADAGNVKTGLRVLKPPTVISSPLASESVMSPLFAALETTSLSEAPSALVTSSRVSATSVVNAAPATRSRFEPPMTTVSPTA